jgi:hypothetical protein
LLFVPIHPDLQDYAQYAQLAQEPRHFEKVIFRRSELVKVCAKDESVDGNGGV